MKGSVYTATYDVLKGGVVKLQTGRTGGAMTAGEVAPDAGMTG